MKYFKAHSVVFFASYLLPSRELFVSFPLPACVCVLVSLCVGREGAASRTRPEAHNMGDGAERELPGKSGAPALGEQWGETQDYILEVIILQF